MQSRLACTLLIGLLLSGGCRQEPASNSASLAARSSASSPAGNGSHPRVDSLLRQDRVQYELPALAAAVARAATIHPALQRITLEKLLAHRSGVRPFTSNAEWQNLPDLGNDADGLRTAYVEHVLRQSPVVPPGSRFAYSNAGYSIAAAMVEAVTGTSWEDGIHQRLFQPLDLDAGFGRPGTRDPDQPCDHWKQGSDTLQVPKPRETYTAQSPAAPAGDVHLSIGDCARHLRGLCTGPLVAPARPAQRVDDDLEPRCDSGPARLPRPHSRHFRCRQAVHSGGPYYLTKEARP